MVEKSLTSLLKGNLGVMMLTAGLWTFAGQLVWPFQSIYVLKLGGTYFHIGLIASIAAISGIIPTLVGGFLADTIGRKKIIYSMSFLLSVNAFIYYFARDWKWLIIGSIIGAIAAGLRQPAFNSILADSTYQESRAQAYALWSIAPPLFGIVSPYIMGVFMDKHGFLPMLRIGYLFLFVFSFLASILRFGFLKETLIDTELSSQKDETYGSFFQSLKETILNLSRPLWILGIMGLLFGLGAAIAGPFWVTYATEDVINLSLSQWGVITAANNLTNIIVSLPLAKIADQRGRMKLLIPSIVLTPFSILAFTFSRNFFQTILVSIMITVLGSMGMSSGEALFSDLTEQRYRGRINALWSIAGTMQSFRIGISPGSLLGATGNLIGGYIYENISKQIPLYIQSGMVGLSAVIGIVFLSEPAKITMKDNTPD
jgi:MFS family permease